MILLRQDMVSLCELCRKYPGVFNRQKLHRWRLDGLRDNDGQVAWLQCVKIGRDWYVSEAELYRFLERVNRQVRPIGNSPRRRRGRLIGPADARQGHDRAKAELDADGWTPMHDRPASAEATAGLGPRPEVPVG